MTSDDFRYSELRYRRLFEAARDGILIIDPATRRIVDVNPFLMELLGCTRGQFIGKELFQIGLLADAAASQAHFSELQKTGYIRYEDLPLKTNDGRRVAVEFVCNLYQEGDRQVIQCNIRDISVRKLAEAVQRASEERFRLIARAMSDVVWDWDLLADTLWWNDGFMTTFGFLAGEIAPSVASWQARIHPDDRGRVVNSLTHAIHSGAESWSADYRLQRKDDSYASVHDRGYLVRDNNGKGVRMVGSMRDLTEQKKMEAHHLRAQRMESIGTLAGGIAHDLNNVFAPIMMSIELLKFDSANDSGRDKILDMILASSRRGANLVRQVLSFARGIDGQRVAIRLGHLIKELEGMITETFPCNIHISSQVPADLWPVIGDSTQLHQVLMNLAVNARDAMPQGGSFTVIAGNAALDAQYASAYPEAKTGSYVLLKVTDTGSGIPPEVRERIFEPFFTTKGIGQGTGIGLATAHTIVKSHGGFMSVESEVGRGTTFTIYLPADPALLPADSRKPVEIDLPRGRNELVLVVDDELAIRDITRQTLETFGYRVITAGNGAEALALYVKQPRQISLVLTDIMMPIMDGVATIQALLSINPSVKIIAASGLSSGLNGAKPARIGVQDFLAKPYTAETLLTRIRDVLDRPAAAQS